MNYKKFALRTLAVVFVLFPHYSFAADVTSGMVALWRFDDSLGTTSLDYVSGTKATFSAQPQWVPGKLSNAATFDGSTVRAVASSTALSNLTALTVSSWIKPSKFGGVDGVSIGRIVSKSGLPGAKRFGFHVAADGSLGFYYGFTQTVGSWKTAPNSVKLNEWQQVVVTYDAINTSVPPVLYINGIAQTITEVSKPVGSPVADDSVLYIGDNPNPSNVQAKQNYFGAIDQVRIYSRSLNQIEVQSVYRVESPVDGLVFRWKYDEKTGLSAYDHINGVPATLLNTPNWVSGKLGAGVNTAGTQYLQTPKITYGNSGNITLSSWINLRAYGGTDGVTNSRILTKEAVPGSVSRRYGLHIGPDGSIGFLAGYLGTQGSWKTASNIVSLNKWHQITVTYSFGDVNAYPNIYLNGVLQPIMTVVSKPVGLPTPEGEKLFIGDNPNLDGSISNRGFKGVIDETRIYNRVLSLGEIGRIYQEDNKPNIIVIMTDDQDDIYSMDYMPNVKELLTSRGTRFSNSFVDFPLCCPSRASFMSGQGAHNHGLISNGRGFELFRPQEGNSLQVWLQKTGYKTAVIGKYINMYGYTVDPVTNTVTNPTGWDKFSLIVSAFGLEYFNYTLNEDGVLKKYGSTTLEYQTDVLANQAVSFISQRKDEGQPFFLWLTPHSPHRSGGKVDDDPLSTYYPVPAPRHNGKFANQAMPNWPNLNEADVSDKASHVKNRPLFSAATSSLVVTSFRKRIESNLAVDEMVAKVVDELKRTGKFDNTIIVFTSDNGWANGQHRRIFGKQEFYEELIKVPLIIAGPGIPVGQTRPHLVNNLDLVATIVDLAGATPGRTLDGASLVPILKNPTTSWRTALLSQGDITNENVAGNARFFAIRTDRYILAEIDPTGFPTPNAGIEREFYDLSTDPYQLENKINDPKYSVVVNSLKAKLSTLKSCAGPNCFVTDTFADAQLNKSVVSYTMDTLTMPFKLLGNGIKSNLNLVASMMGIPPSYALEETAGRWWISR